MIFDPKKIRQEFPLYVNNPGLVYMDSAATSLTPTHVINTITDYYSKYNANVHRGVYAISILATEMYERAHRVVAELINAETKEIVFNSGATAGLNNLANGLEHLVGAGDSIVVTRLEHHANLIPWQELVRRKGATLRFIELDKNLDIDLESAKSVIDSSTKIVSVTQASNTLGTLVPVKEIVKIAKEVGAISIIDGSQSVPHMTVDVKDIDCDFLVFSGHKILGPTGIGVMFGKMSALEKLNPVVFGGAMISSVTYDKATWGEIPQRFEAGTPDISGALGLAAAIEYAKKIGIDNIAKHEQMLTEYALKRLKEVAGLRVIGNPKKRIGIISFVIDGLHSFDVGTMLDEQSIAVRTGHHCTQPLLDMIGEKNTVRISFYMYNSESGVDKLIEALQKIIIIAKQDE